MSEKKSKRRRSEAKQASGANNVCVGKSRGRVEVWVGRAGAFVAALSAIVGVYFAQRGVQISADAQHDARVFFERSGPQLRITSVVGETDSAPELINGQQKHFRIMSYQLTNVGRLQVDVVGISVRRPSYPKWQAGCFGIDLPFTLQPGQSHAFVASAPREELPASKARVLLSSGEEASVAIATTKSSAAGAREFGEYLLAQSEPVSKTCSSGGFKLPIENAVP